MKRFLFFIMMLFAFSSKAQVSGSFTVGGDLAKFYPVIFLDGGWTSNVASELEIGRSSIHENTQGRGSLIAKFNYHLTRWGNKSNFIDAEIRQKSNGVNPEDIDFIAGFEDATKGNAEYKMIIWLRGGGTTYFYRSKFATTVTIYDGIANPLPFQETGGAAHTFKSAVDSYVNSWGTTKSGTVSYGGVGNNFFNGSVSIGTRDPKGYKLAVAGNMIAESIKVKLQNAWPDYVFAKDYKLSSLLETETHIKEKGHLPGIPSAEQVKKEGIDLGDMNAKLLQKIEELTLHLIEIKRENKAMNDQILIQQKAINKLLKKQK